LKTNYIKDGIIVKQRAGVRVFYHLAVLLFACLLFSHCTEKNPVQPASKNPQIVLIQAPERVYQFPAAPTGIHVRAEDPQGDSTLAGVQLTIRRTDLSQLATFTMGNDGLNGDILAGDGQYFLPIDTALVHGQTGTFILEAVARDRDNFTSEARHDTLTILAGKENLPPLLIPNSVDVPPVILADSSYRPQLLARASDPDGAGMVRFVRLEIYPPFSPRPAPTDSLFDDGRHGDGAAGDGLFGQTLLPSRFGQQCGPYNFVFRAVDVAGDASPAEIKVVAIELSRAANLPPQLAGLQAPSTISRRATPNTYVLSVRATDPNGRCDGIARVFFKSFKPNGEPTNNGNSFPMRDDGKLGDAVAGDRRYSLTIEISPDAATGNYRFEFQAEDQKGAQSAKLIHTITVTD
jgi:hypothetical protein